MKPDVLVAHSSYWVGIARLPAVLQEAGAKVTVICPKGTVLAKTRYVDHRIAGSANLAKFGEQLRNLLREHDYDWVILADDDLICEIQQYADEPRVQAALPVMTALGLKVMNSKIAFLEACKVQGLPVAMSRTVTTLSE